MPITQNQEYPGPAYVGQAGSSSGALTIANPPGAQAAPAVSAGDLLLEFTAGDLAAHSF
jgi:hypothetical protein